MPSKILIVEDESIVALDLGAKLRRLGYQVIGIADSGEEAIRVAEAGHPDLVLMDIRLKGSVDGIDTARQLRARYNIPAIYLTAYADNATLQRAKLTEPFGYLIKPFEERELQSTLEMALYKMEAEKTAQEQATRLERIIATVPEGVALLGGDWRIVVANARARDFLVPLAGAAVGDKVEGLGAYSLEQLMSPPDREIWHEISIGESPSPRRVFEVIVKPVSPGAVAEPSSGEFSNSEWVLVIHEVTVDREIQQRAQLQDRLAAVGQLSAGIAHDFNNILSSILLSSQVIQMMAPDLPAKIGERLRSISVQAKRASDLIKQILDFSRASALEMQPIELTPLLNELEKMFERMLPENIRVEMEIAAAPAPGLIVGDATRIQQALVNLALNARDAMPNGGTLHVDMSHVPGQAANLRDAPKHDNWVRIRVSDTGTGIHPEALPRIFEPFFTTKEPGKGTGLGLAQVYGIVQQHSGYITVDSETGRGTAFSIFLPALPPTSEERIRSVNEEPDLAQGDEQTILLVEDNPDARESMGDLLDLLNYHVLTAANGREALAILEEGATQVDLILSDLVMPEMGGLELCRELRRKKMDVKIIILTGYASDESLAGLQDLSISDYLHKPVDLERLSRSIEGVLPKHTPSS